MSLERVRTDLDGFDDQVFPSILDDINFVYGEFSDIYDEDKLNQACSFIPGYLSSDMPFTDDGYGWLKGFYFQLPQGKIAVLFPWVLDLDKKDDSELDRSVAFYVSGNVTISEGENLARLILDVL